MNKQFKIAKILDEYNIVINAGTNHGVAIGDEFQILDVTSNPVEDPDTKEIIGYLNLIKASVIVIDVQEKMCICTSEESKTSMGILADTLSNMTGHMHPYGKTEKVRLNIDYSDVTGGLSKSNEPIRVGDSVKLIKSK